MNEQNLNDFKQQVKDSGDMIIDELDKANIIGEKHAKRMKVSVNILSVILNLVLFWRKNRD